MSAMKMFQKLVGLTQDMQLSDSRIHGGQETKFVKDFREIEYKIRELVEDTMRSAVSTCSCCLWPGFCSAGVLR